MNLLRQVPHSVLWLLKESETGAENLRQAAKKQGIAPERLVFSEKLADKGQHLSRLKLADLALDPWIANGQATTADLLLAGVPVVTLQGTHFPSRAGSSILMAAGLPELIAYSPAGYERIALRLARQPRLLEGLKAKIARNQSQKPFFDPGRFVAYLEAGFQRVWERFVAGKPAEPIVIGREEAVFDSGLADAAAKKKFPMP
jgi:predicted O-linked N-acetylglucosamine transferase (SPINDLY family)